MDTDEINRQIHEFVKGKLQPLHSWVLFPDEPCWSCGLLKTPENLEAKCSPPIPSEYIPDYCNDLNLSLLAVEKMVEQGAEIDIDFSQEDKKWNACIIKDGPHCAVNSSLAKAICLAILKAGRAE